MKNVSSFLVGIVALLIASCNLPVEDPSTLSPVFHAEIAPVGDGDAAGTPATRTYMDGTGANIQLHWTTQDAISVFSSSTSGRKYIFQGATGDISGTFLLDSQQPEVTGGVGLDRNYALYPYSGEATISEQGVISTKLPKKQTWVEGSFGPGACVMTAVTSGTDDENLLFKNVLCFIKLQLYGGTTVKKIKFSGNDNEPLAGTVGITQQGGLPEIVGFATGAETELTLSCPDGVATGETEEGAVAFIIALPPRTFEHGFKVTVTDMDGIETVKSRSSAITLERNHIQPMAAFQLNTTPPIPELPPVNNGLPVLYVYMPGFEPAAQTTETLTNVGSIGKEEWIEGSHAYLKDVDGTVTDLGGASIRGRGNTTWNYKKKPYALKLDKKKELLGMPADKRWDLLANYIDRTRLRNDLALELGRRLAERGIGFDWTPRGKYVELVVNNVFLGNYYLVEHIKIATNRVNITEMKSEDIAEPEVTGGYLLECGIEMDEVNQFWTNYFTDVYPYNRHGKSGGMYHIPVMVKDPDEDVMVPAQLTWLQNYINRVQGDIVANNGNWHNDIDMDSFICWMFVQEVVDNFEPFHPKSAFMHKDRNGKLMMGPLWDFDYGTFNWTENDKGYPVYHYSMWYPYMLKDAAFKARVNELWPIVKPVFEAVCSEYASKYKEANATTEVMNLAVSIDNDWVRWKNLGGQPNVNGDENLGIWVAFKRLTDKMSYRITKINDVEINNMNNM